MYLIDKFNLNIVFKWGYIITEIFQFENGEEFIMSSQMCINR